MSKLFLLLDWTDQNTAYVRAVRNAIAADNRGSMYSYCCVKIWRPPGLPTPTLRASFVLCNCQRVKFICCSISGTSLKAYLYDLAQIATAFLANLPDPSAWKTITVSSSAFPENLGAVPPRSVESLPRVELQLRDELASRKRKIPRFPTFGDYGICHPDLLDFDPRTHTPSAAIRYTTERKWLIVKAGSIKKHKLEQFRQLSDTLRKRPEYYGENYSWGDRYISECADCNVGHGNLTTWRQVGTNHHVTLVANQIASSPSI